MATLLRTSNTEETVDPANGTDFQFEELQAFVGGTISLTHGVDADGKLHRMVANDDGYELNLPINAKATAMYMRACRPGSEWHNILGDVLICDESEIQ